MPRGKSKPTISDGKSWAQADIKTWLRRDDRFELEQNEFYLKQRVRPQDNEEVVTPNDPAFLTEKAARLLARLEETVEIIPRDPSNNERAQKIENLVRTLRRQWVRQWGRGLHGPLDYEEAKYLIQRGWLVSRITKNTNEKSKEPILYSVWDPANVYPYEVGGELVRVTHRYKASISTLLGDDALPESEDAFSLIDDNSKHVDVYSQYVKHNGIYYHMVWTSGVSGTRVGISDSSGEWLKKPTEIGYMPWVIDWAIGTPWRATQFDDTDYIEHIGESFWTNMSGMYKQQSKMMSMLATIIATMANPPTALFQENGGKIQASEISMKPGSRMVFDKGNIEQFRLGAGLQDIVAYWQMLQDRQNKSSFAAVSFGEQTGIESGYMGESLKAGNADVMFPYTECMRFHRVKCYEKALDIMAQHWVGSVEVYAQQNVNRPAQMQTVNYTDIIEEDPYIQVGFKTQSLQERMQLANMAAALRRDNLIDLQTARGKDFLNLDDPYLIEQRVQADLIKTDPAMIKAMIPLALAFTGMRLEKELYGVLHGSEIAQMLMAGLQGASSQQQPQNGQPPMPGAPGGIPPGPPGMDGAAVPPVVAGGQIAGSPPMRPEEQQMLQIVRMMMGAQGGMGQGGIPPGM